MFDITLPVKGTLVLEGGEEKNGRSYSDNGRIGGLIGGRGRVEGSGRW